MTPFNLTAQFLKAATNLEKDKANKTFKALLLYFSNQTHPGLNFEKLKGRAAALHSIRVDQGFRIVMQVSNAMTVFHYVGNHDDAYRQAETIAIVIPARLGGGRSA